MFIRKVELLVCGALLLGACTKTIKPSFEKNILFVGNSYTLQHDMPGRVVEELNELHGPDTAYYAVTVASNGQNLTTFVDDPRILAAFKQVSFDAIVLQDRSTATFYRDEHREFFEATRWFKNKAVDEGAEVFLFQTWPRRADNEFYKQTKGNGFTPPRTQKEMMLKLEATYQLAASRQAAIVAPVGRCWMKDSSYSRFYASDGSHASREGATFAAGVIARTIDGAADPCGG